MKTTNVNDVFITIKTAKKIKELNLQVPCNSYYVEAIEPHCNNVNNRCKDVIAGEIWIDDESAAYPDLCPGLVKTKIYPRPTQANLQKWLRDMYNIKLSIQFLNNWKWYVDDFNFGYDVHDTYEEALEEGLFEVLNSSII